MDNDRGAEKVPGADLWMDRSFTNVKKGRAAGTIEIAVVEQRMRIDSHNVGEAAAPEQRLLVVCSVSGSRPACSSRISDSR